MKVLGMYPNKATLWVKDVADGEGGFTYQSPRSIDVLWLDKRVVFQDEMGKELQSSIVVYSKEPIDFESYMALGVFTDLDPRLLYDRAYRVRGRNYVSSLCGKYMQYKNFLESQEN